MKPKADLRERWSRSRPGRSDHRSRPLRDHALLCVGVTRVGFTRPASRRRVARRSARRARRCWGLITAANGISWVAAPALGMALYLVSRTTFAISSLLLVALAVGRDGGCRRFRPPALAVPPRERSIPGSTKPMPSGERPSLFRVFWMRSIFRIEGVTEAGSPKVPLRSGHSHPWRPARPKRGKAGAADEIHQGRRR